MTRHDLPRLTLHGDDYHRYAPEGVTIDVHVNKDGSLGGSFRVAVLSGRSIDSLVRWLGVEIRREAFADQLPVRGLEEQ